MNKSNSRVALSHFLKTDQVYKKKVQILVTNIVYSVSNNTNLVSSILKLFTLNSVKLKKAWLQTNLFHAPLDISQVSKLSDSENRNKLLTCKIKQFVIPIFGNRNEHKEKLHRSKWSFQQHKIETITIQKPNELSFLDNIK